MGTVNCWHCKERFIISDETHAVLRRSSQNFCCPFGHLNHYPKGDTPEDELRRERDRLKQNAAYLESEARRLREQRDAADRRAAAARGQVTKLKKRVSAGVCPCCNRQFADLHRHMAGKHPGFMAEEVAGAPLH